jgi:hypothetical protein
MAHRTSGAFRNGTNAIVGRAKYCLACAASGQMPSPAAITASSSWNVASRRPRRTGCPLGVVHGSGGSTQ